MQIYELGVDYESKKCIRGIWSPDQTEASATTLGVAKWTPVTDLKFADDWRVAQSEHEKFASHWQVLNLNSAEARSTIGYFSRIFRDLPLVNGALKAAIEAAAPGAVEFIETTRVWVEKLNTPLEGGPYHIMNVVERRNASDDEVMNIVKRQHADGHWYETAAGPARAMRASALNGATIWRESRTNFVLCTEKVKMSLIAAGCAGWDFNPIEITNR